MPRSRTCSIDLWLLDIDLPEGEVAALRTSLSHDEQERAARFVYPAHRNRYIAGRGQLRARLAAYLGCDPAEIAFGTGEHGKPHLRDAPEPLHFNLSHSGGIAVIAVSRQLELGVDVAELRPVEEGLPRRFFAPGECARLDNLPPAERLAAFFRCWTRKEAFIKAVGGGLSIPLNSFEVSIEDEPEPRLLWRRDDPQAPERWRMFSYALSTKAVVALALDAQGCEVEVNWRNADAMAGLAGAASPRR